MSDTTADAKQLLFDLSLFQIPVDPIEVCRRLGVIYDEQPYEGFDGTLIVQGGQQLIGVNSAIREPGRKAFTCAHELGHYQYDVNCEASFLCTRDDVGYGKAKTDPREIRANEFASELLMPRDFFLAAIQRKPPSWELLRALSKSFQTSLQATANRFVKLTHHLCWLVVVKEGVIQRFTRADHNDFNLQVRRSFKPPSKDPGSFKETLADSWLYPSRRTKNKTLMYWPLPTNRYGECSVLLWDSTNTLMDENYVGDEFDEEQSRRDDGILRRGRW